ncbi:MAG: FeoA family protein, partial [Deinococcus sp.]
HPTHDPHGDPIPALDGSLPRRSEGQLRHAPLGARLTVARIPAHDPAQLRSLVAGGLTPGAELSVLEHDPAFGTLSLSVGGERRVLSLEVASLVLVTPAPDLADAGTALMGAELMA